MKYKQALSTRFTALRMIPCIVVSYYIVLDVSYARQRRRIKELYNSRY
jgi:hypothetical protein